MPSFHVCVQVPLPHKPSSVSGARRDQAKVFGRSISLPFVSEETCFATKVDASTRHNKAGVGTSVLVHVFSYAY
jgi:hypothetical protein